MLVCLIIISQKVERGGGQHATHGMLQKEFINSFRKPARQNAKLLLKMTISNLRDIWSNTALIEFCQAKSEVQRRFPKYF